MDKFLFFFYLVAGLFMLVFTGLTIAGGCLVFWPIFVDFILAILALGFFAPRSWRDWHGKNQERE